jgi:trans-aconitate 2-methyltransferase
VTDWNAAEYHRVSEPQLAWGLDVLARLELRGDETAADVGCGTGRLTAQLRDRLPRGRVIAVDSSETMLEQARACLQGEGGLVRADAAALPFSRALNLIFSTATFHWVHDHDRLFASVYWALKPGGRLVAQCGGGPNLQRLLERADALMHRPDFAPYFAGWRAPWNFADADTTHRRLETAGFVRVVTALYPSPVSFDSAETYRAFVKTVCVRHHVARLPPELQADFTAQLSAEAVRDDPPLTLDYWRLDMTASVPFLQSRSPA